MDSILIVEDEQYVREFILINLERNNFHVFEAQSGEEALGFLKNNNVDLVVLDLNLPGIDGYKVCKEIKANNSNIAVIMVTAKSQDMDKIIGLELGADDYITKPFNPQELVARIRAVLRRTKKTETKLEIIYSGRIKINYVLHKVYKDNVELKLTPKEFEIIYTLANNTQKTFSRNELLDLLWGENYFGDMKTLDVHVRRLREKIEDDPSNPYFIETVWGIGYRWKR